MKSPLRNTFLLTLLVMGMLILLTAFPPLGKWDRLKPVDVFSSVRPDKEETIPPALLTRTEKEAAVLDSVATEIQSACPPGITCFEDFTKNQTALKYFVKAIRNMEKEKKPVRIAFYGDSFIEGDVFCGSFRDTLQTIFGGRGVGFVPITSNVTGFRNTIKHRHENWQTFSIVSRKDSTASLLPGPSGYSYKPLENAWVEYRVSRQRYLREFTDMKLYYRNRGNAALFYTINDTTLGVDVLKKGERMKEWRYHTVNGKSVEFQFENADSLELYGASFEGKQGVYVDNFSVRGNSGVSLDNIPDNMLSDFDKFRDYKLILLQYGLNVVRDDSTRYGWYAGRMMQVIEKLKKNFPKASIILVSVSDRSINTGAGYKTEKGIPALRNTQRYIAQKTGIAFWDLYKAMGGQDSMVKFVSSKPALAAKDYTHLTFVGGKKLAHQLAASLLHELERHEKSKGKR